MAREIVKVQRPIMPPDGTLLVYAEGHDRMEQKLSSPELRKALGEDLKGYFEAEHTASGWTLGKRVQAQTW